MDIFHEQHFSSITAYMKQAFGKRIVKLALDSGLSCPNRDGSLGYGGCGFCLGGSGEFTAPIDAQIKAAKEKWREPVSFIAYFQSYTNTYAPAEYLRMLWNEALSHEGVIGLAVATRPDCIDGEILQALCDFNEKCFLWVELGLQTENQKTSDAFNRAYPNEAFENTMKLLNACGIKTVVHLILGLPGEDEAQYIKSAKYAASFKPFGLKLQMLHLLKNTAMGEQYLKEPFKLLSREEYVNCIVDILERIPKEIIIHRLTGDAPKDMLIAPLWTMNKHDVLNAIQHEFAVRGSCQGYKL